MPEVPTQAEPVADIRTRIANYLCDRLGVSREDADPLLRLASIGFDKTQDVQDQISALKGMMPYTYPSVKSIDVNARVDASMTIKHVTEVKSDLVALLDGLQRDKAALRNSNGQMHLNHIDTKEDGEVLTVDAGYVTIEK